VQPRRKRTGNRRIPTLRSPACCGENPSGNPDEQPTDRGKSSLCGDVAATSFLASLSCSKPKWAAGLAPRTTPNQLLGSLPQRRQRV